MSKLENVLAKKRYDLGMSLNDFLEKKIGISRPTYDSLVSGKHGYTVTTIQKIADYLGAKPSEVMTMLEESD